MLLRPDGTLLADMFDGTGFVRGIARKGFEVRGARCLVVGAGGVGSAIAASLAAAGVGAIALFDTDRGSAEALAGRLRQALSGARRASGRSDPAGYDLVVNGTPLGMKPGDPLPFDVSRLEPRTFVGEVVMKQEITPLLDGRARPRLPLPGRHRHAVRDDPGVPRVLRLRHGDARRAAGGRAGLL